jgi:methionyl aminopeptidase
VRQRVDHVASPDVIVRMRRAGRAGREVLDVTGAAVRAGISTDELDAIAHEAYIARGGYPSTLNYHGYPKSICTSVNEVICHGIPDDRELVDGDIVNVDVTIYLDGVHGDCSRTYLVGDVDPASRKLVEVTERCMWQGIAAVRPGGRVRDIGRAIQSHAEANGFGVVRAFVGHGIGEQFHTDLTIPHYDDPTANTILVPGMIFTVEPMITEGAWTHDTWDDGWTAVTTDLGRTAQFEHTVLVTDVGVEVLTLAADEPQPFPH